MKRRERYDGRKRLAAAVICRAISDAQGDVEPNAKPGTLAAEHIEREARRFLRGGMLPWADMLDTDIEKMRTVGRELAEKAKNRREKKNQNISKYRP